MTSFEEQMGQKAKFKRFHEWHHEEEQPVPFSGSWFHAVETSNIFYWAPKSHFVLAVIFRLGHANNLHYILRALSMMVWIWCCCIF